MKWLWLFTLIIGLIPAGNTWAKSNGMKPTHRHAQAVAKEVIELRGRLLREMVGLSNERAEEAENVLKSFDDEHQKYTAMLDASKRQVHALLEVDSNDSDAYTMAVESMRRAHQRLHELRDRQFRAMQELLAPKEQALFFQSLGRLRHEVRKRMRRARHSANQ